MSKNSTWIVVGESVIGQSHIKTKTPCQDSNSYENIANDWGIAVVADGAGTASKAHEGSAFVTQEALKGFKDLLEKEKWHQLAILPNEKEWAEKSRQELFKIYQKLLHLAETQKTAVEHFSCTVIVLIYSPLGILITHIGDGRAAYANEQKEWKAALAPWKGEYANETVFITSDIWENDIEKFIYSQVIQEPPSAFALMSDGLERYAFEVSVWDDKAEKYYDANKPFAKFFQPVSQNLINMRKNKISEKEMKEKWRKFLDIGNAKIKIEPDDKTMILGVKAE